MRCERCRFGQRRQYAHQHRLGFRWPVAALPGAVGIDGTDAADRPKVLVEKKPPTVGAIVVYYAPEGAVEQECGPKRHVLAPGGASCDAPVPQETKLELIKRIVAGPGDEIFVRGGHVYRKAKGTRKFIRESDLYIRACGGVPECNFPIPIKISAGHWFLMGDNRGESDDSRFWGPVPTAWIVGVATTL